MEHMKKLIMLVSISTILILTGCERQKEKIAEEKIMKKQKEAKKSLTNYANEVNEFMEKEYGGLTTIEMMKKMGDSKFIYKKISNVDK